MCSFVLVCVGVFSCVYGWLQLVCTGIGLGVCVCVCKVSYGHTDGHFLFDVAEHLLPLLLQLLLQLTELPLFLTLKELQSVELLPPTHTYTYTYAYTCFIFNFPLSSVWFSSSGCGFSCQPIRSPPDPIWSQICSCLSEMKSYSHIGPREKNVSPRCT